MAILVVGGLVGLGVWLAIAFGTSSIAKAKGRDPVLWWWAGALLGLIGLIWAAALTPVGPLAHGGVTAASGGLSRCPFCAEVIQPRAIVCRWCGRDLLIRVAPVASSAQGEAPADEMAVISSDNAGLDTAVGQPGLRLAGTPPEDAARMIHSLIRLHPQEPIRLDLTDWKDQGPVIQSLLDQTASLGAPGATREMVLLNAPLHALFASIALAGRRGWDWKRLSETSLVVMVRTPA
jgi:hypothetical protein